VSHGGSKDRRRAQARPARSSARAAPNIELNQHRMSTSAIVSWNGLVRLVDKVCVGLWHDCRGSPAAAACRSRIAALLERLRNALCGAGVPPFELALPAAPSFVAIENALWDITGHIAGNSEIVACLHALRSELRVFRDAAASCRHSSALNTCVFASSALSTCFFALGFEFTPSVLSNSNSRRARNGDVDGRRRGHKAAH